FTSEMCEDTKFEDAEINFTDRKGSKEVTTRFWSAGKTDAIIMGVNATPSGPPIGIVVFLIVPENITLGEIVNFTLKGLKFAINLGQPDDFAESWMFSIPPYGMGNLFRIRWKDRSVMPIG
ncbi:Hypothetical predicted protein, partial [Paramuricea clavata]